MLFNLKVFLQDLKDNPEKRDVYIKYDKLVESLDKMTSTKEMKWYQEYSARFEIKKYLVPDELIDDFDWDLLVQLIASSFSSDGLLEATTKSGLEFIIAVRSGEKIVVKKISELWGFQILRLFHIYIEEQMNLAILICEDNNEKEAITNQREMRYHRWNIVLNNIGSEEIFGKYGL